jgi:hypothetical protein
MRTLITCATIVAAVLSLALAARAIAGGLCCSHCGGYDRCHKVCRLVCEEKKVEIVCWGCKCEDFCLPKCGERGCKHCETVCEDCETQATKNGICSAPHRFVWFDWRPGGASMHTKTKLMKKVIVRKVPTYKYVVEDLCDTCAAKVEVTDQKPVAK